MARSCTLCLGRSADCPRCGQRARFQRGFTRVRVGILLLVLLLVCAWAAKERSRVSRRASWNEPVVVDVVLLGYGRVAPSVFDVLRREVPRLEQVLADEHRRYRPGSSMPPFRFEVFGPVQVTRPPPPPPESSALWERTVHYMDLRRYIRGVHERGGMNLSRHSLHVYVVVEPVHRRVGFAEGYGAVGADIGVVRTSLPDEGSVDQALIAIAHEAMHCLGAQDKYDGDGHAMEPAGLAEPELVPAYPQRFGEIMVGEVPLRRGQGRLMRSLAEVRVGALTAREIGWLR